ncbi:MAG: sulfite exporter TauE/SafE family protein [Gallionellaceae bacterium]|nr:sulfite exporter TauE/SafE family protein [Gallionellaceae bacterium]MDD5367031.1 sulfite exporter TauE/SafE family protein [Gallionellaceae bacterium]
MSFLITYLILGLASGFIAGLLGVGGGLVLVPVLSWIYLRQGFPAEYNIHMALGTSLAVIVLTSIASLRAHHSHGAVRWIAVRRIAPGIVLGTLAGAIAAAWLPDRGLRWFFVAFLFYAATQMLLGFKANPHRELPGWPGMSLAGTVIGLVSSWVGIGGGTLSVPFLNWCNVRFQEAIGTSAAIGFPIAVSGALGYALSGQMAAGLPEWSLGFVYLPALASVALMSMVTAPWGARLTHSLPVARLKRIFAGLLYLLGLRMLYGLLT